MDLPPIARQACLARLDAQIVRNRESGTDTGLMLIDLANLKQINHQHSFRLGDALICETLTSLETLSLIEDSVYRIGARRFALIVPDLQNPALLAMALNRVRQCLDEALELDHALTPVKVVTGLAITHELAPNALALLASAEIHLSEVKSTGRTNLDSVFNKTFEISGADELQQPFEVALQNNGFSLYYQPQVCLRTGRIVGAEALLRWRHEPEGFVSPERIIKIAEDLGLSFELTKSLAHVAIRQMSKWRQSAMDVPVALNVPADLISQSELPGMLQAALKIWGVPASALTVEITEQAIVQGVEADSTTLAQLREAGLHISIDDFGTGYSSLSYFRHIPAGELKIDRSFIDRLTSSAQDRALIRIIIDIAHLYKMQVVAEGVEDLESLAVLQQLDCDVIQGYFIARPMDADTFEVWMRDWKGLESFVTDGNGDPGHTHAVVAFCQQMQSP